MDASLLAILSIVAAVYAAALALMSLPFREFKAWGHAAFMHSITSIGLLAVIPTLVAVRGLIAPYVQPYIGVDISAGPETALAHITQYRLMVFEWINAVNLSAEALGAIQGVMMLALTPLLLSGRRRPLRQHSIIPVLRGLRPPHIRPEVPQPPIPVQRGCQGLHGPGPDTRGRGCSRRASYSYAVPIRQEARQDPNSLRRGPGPGPPARHRRSPPKPRGGGGRDPEDPGDTGVLA